MPYASSTTVSVDKSRSEIEGTLQRYGASSFAYGYEATQAAIEFAMNDRRIRFIIPMPDRNDREFTHTPSQGRRRTMVAAQKEYEQATRQKWRALLLVVKAKLEAVDAGITEFDDEFLSHLVLPDGTTVGDRVVPQVALAYETGVVPPGFSALALPEGGR